ncbi:hypothetical protein DBR32_05275 [Taibaiella sp. KBW10]|uniref:energy transducer TonB n=1 Tax=Taibaiella sp. KBW10 TaxID=2153357 RepID=UPI000F598BFF|nr:energy transducer TonB [Taibaiella sp. KBW10]RQO31376.1 hypothetical protein DBR32_05275 [Taibaiella sp. KBW10]
MMNTQNQNGYLDLLFENRNKKYGAYELRKNYNQRMLKAAAIASLMIFTAVFLSTIKSNNKIAIASTQPKITDTTTYVLKKVKIERPKIQEPEVITSRGGKTAKTQEHSTPTIVKDKLIDKPVMKMLDKDALAGPVDNIGLKDGTAIALDKSLNKDGEPGEVFSKKGEKKETVIAKEEETKPINVAEEMPEFPGGLAAWKKYLSENLKYPLAAREAPISGLVYVSFVVAKDGSLSEIKIIRGIGGGCDEEAARVLGSAPKWKAGKQNGYAVSVRMTLPIRFNLH